VVAQIGAQFLGALSRIHPLCRVFQAVRVHLGTLFGDYRRLGPILGLTPLCRLWYVSIRR